MVSFKSSSYMIMIGKDFDLQVNNYNCKKQQEFFIIVVMIMIYKIRVICYVTFQNTRQSFMSVLSKENERPVLSRQTFNRHIISSILFIFSFSFLSRGR